MRLSKLQIQMTQVVILIAFSAAGFETAAALFSWRSGALVPKYLILAVILLAAGFLLNEVYRRFMTGSINRRTMREPNG